MTSPPYWRKRDYGHPDQIGQEPTPEKFAAAIGDCLAEWSRVLRPTGSVFLNIGDTYGKRGLSGIPWRIETVAAAAGWTLRNRIVWAKTSGMPDPARNRLANRHEFVLHLVRRADYFYDLAGYRDLLGANANPGDVWLIEPERNRSAHLAPFPAGIARRAIVLACPTMVCRDCGQPSRRIEERTTDLDESRPQARRAMALAQQGGLTDAHLRAVAATGLTDTGKSASFQNGTGCNAADVQRLAAEAKTVLGGYFREYANTKRVTVGWTDCGHGALARGRVLDPFAGTGTTLRAAKELGRDAVGFDLNPAPARIGT
ncbi:DNA-methyltransferase [Nostocoides jenkinsii]|uniref:Methyltransferase n=1 Tax=Nostocoides jenkinsii Ben 74 TaxID=1193518 RepID=A0A077M8U1_9MICO